MCDKACSHWSKLLDIRSQVSKLVSQLVEFPREQMRSAVVDNIKSLIVQNEQGNRDRADPRFMWFRFDRFSPTSD